MKINKILFIYFVLAFVKVNLSLDHCVTEFNDNYCFHDSILDKLEYSDGELKLYCEFCDFMQDKYDSKDDTNSDIIVVFHNAEYQISGKWQICGAGFLDQRIENNSIIFFMESSTDEFGELLIKANSVDVFKVRTYNL